MSTTTTPTFSALSIRGGGLAKYYNNEIISNSKTIIPNTGYNTVIYNNESEDNSTNTIELGEGGYLIFDTKIKTDILPKIKVSGGTIIFNKDIDLYPIISDANNKLTMDFNCDIIINENVKIFCNSEKHKLIIKKLFNFGVLLLHNKETLFSSSETGTIIYNYNEIRINTHCEIKGSITNSGKIYIYDEVNFINGRFSNDENGITNVETNGSLTFDNKDYTYDYIIKNLGGIVNIKEGGKLILRDKSKSIKYLLSNFHILKIDGEIINETNEKIEILNNVNSIIYLENDTKITENIRFNNEDNIISFISDKFDLLNNDKGKYLNIPKLYYMDKENKEISITKTEDIINYIYELNSSDIEPAVLNTISLLLLNKALYTGSITDISEILKILRLNIWFNLPGYSQLKKQFI